MSSINELNFTGKISLAGIAATSVNVAVHPFCTYKNRTMLGLDPYPSNVNNYQKLKSLYQGITAIALTEFAQLSFMFIANEYFKRHNCNDIISGGLSGALSAPIIALGEGVMIHQQSQRGNHKLSLGQAFQNSLRGRSLASSLHSLTATALREVPYGIAILAFPKYVKEWLPITNELLKNSTAGFISGATLGFVSTPLDTAKTRVQGNGMTLSEAVRSVWRDFRTRGQHTKILEAARMRMWGSGFAVAIATVVNQRVPEHFPGYFQK